MVFYLEISCCQDHPSPRRDLSRLVAVVYPLAPKMGYIEVVHKPNKTLWLCFFLCFLIVCWWFCGISFGLALGLLVVFVGFGVFLLALI